MTANHIHIPARILYRLESDNTIIDEETQVFSVDIDETMLALLQETGRRAGTSLDAVLTHFATETIADWLAADEAVQAKRKGLATKHRTAIVTEVKLKEKIIIP